MGKVTIRTVQIGEYEANYEECYLIEKEKRNQTTQKLFLVKTLKLNKGG